VIGSLAELSEVAAGRSGTRVRATRSPAVGGRALAMEVQR
jgi:hypothetical protein